MKKNNKKIVFISYNNNLGSYKLRVKQIINSLNFNNISILKCHKKTNFIDNINLYKNSIFIWVCHINVDDLILSRNNNNINIYDCVDKYLYDYENINYILNNNYIDCLIVNNNYMKTEIKENTKFKGNIEIIYHHYDPILKNVKLIYQDKLTFGYMGSIASLRHTDNFLYYKKLMFKYPIEFLNTEDGLYYTNDVLHNVIINGKPQENITNMFLNFNCHISIREINSNISKYKTTAKLATSCFFNHNIITTNEESVKDILPENYPFLLKSSDYNSVIEMFDLITKDYYSDKKLWNFGLEIMNDVKKKLNLEIIKEEYIKMINNYL